MNIRKLADPELLPFVDAFPPLATSAVRLRELRELFGGTTTTQPSDEDLPDDVAWREVRCPSTDGSPDVRLLLYTPKVAGGARPVLIFLHGGGYVLGSPEDVHGRSMRVASMFGCVVASVDYRLAPETRHPGPVEDCYAVLRFLHDHVGELGIDADRIGVMGESAGGGLAAALALLARDRGQYPLAFQVLVYPMLDDRSCVSSDPATGHPIWTRETNTFGWSALLGREPGGEDIDYYAAAGRAPDLAGLPKTFMAVGTADLLLNEDLTYARRLMHAGVATELHVYPGAVHGFIMAAGTRLTHQLHSDLGAAIARFLG